MFGDSGRPPSDDKQRVLDATDIVRLIGDHLALKKKGREYVGLCPFHDDHSPSMCVVPHKQMYHCFSCEAGGNAIGFVMNYHKMTYPEALKYLADRAGIELTPWKPRTSSRGPFSGERGDDFAGEPGETPKAGLLRASSTAQTFFRAILNHQEHGRAAREVIAKRRISPEMVELFQLGATPDKWDGLLLTIQSKGLDPTPFRQAGLLKARENASGMYDSFRNRLMFPIQDQLGRVIAFGGRRLNDQEEPKYLNSSESPIFDKSSSLYGLYQAAQEIRKTRMAIVTEGYMDAIACHQAGVCNAVATLGTAMTPGNARLLKRLCDTVVLLFDGDEAGSRAAARAVEVFFSEPVDVKICVLSRVTDAKDPDELLKREGGVELLSKAIAQSIDPLELMFSRVKASIEGQGISAQTKAIEEFTANLVELGLGRLEPVRYQLIVRRLAEITGVSWETITTTLSQRRARVRPREDASAARATSRPLTPGEHLLGCIMCDPSLTLSLNEEHWELIEPESFEDAGARAVARVLMDVTVDELSPSLQTVLLHTEDAEVQRVAARLASEVDRLTQGDAGVLKRHWRDRLLDAQRARLARVARSPGGPGGAPVRDTAAGAGGASDGLGGGAEALAVKLERIRKQRQTLGEDPRAVPKPVP